MTDIQSFVGQFAGVAGASYLVWLPILAFGDTLGVPVVSGEALYVGVGILASLGSLSFVPAAFLALVFSALGVAGAFALGRTARYSVKLSKAALRAQKWASTHPFLGGLAGLGTPKSLFLVRFVPIARVYATYPASASGVRFRTFSLPSLAGTAAFVSMLLVAGVAVGRVLA